MQRILETLAYRMVRTKKIIFFSVVFLMSHLSGSPR